uniref:Uncharacterized protein n=1 Tax=Gossypium raimondii TaxID=29730 RepID=A0A0D2VPX8_GOSRA|nr:hypothetical protein B456_011G212000 [Gossypium raimondii]
MIRLDGLFSSPFICFINTTLTLLLNTKEGRPMLPKKKNQSKSHHQHDTGNLSAGEDDVTCCPATTKKGGGGFMNMLCKALGCCGLLSACYDPRTPH